MSAAPDDPRPLAGVRVLDLAGYIAGPYGCTLLADQGADVIKVEPPEGDNLRTYPSTLAAEGRAFIGVNRGKRGISLDLKAAVGRAVLARLVERADVLVHNFRPSVPPRLGLDWPTLHARNPRLIVCALSGYGDTGPLKDKAGYDQVLQAMSGLCAMQGTPASPQIVYGSVVDYYAASLISGAVASALFARERTGIGRYVPVSLLRAALAMQSARLVWAETEGRDVNRDMRSGGITGLHPTLEGTLYVSANTPHFWAALCELTGLAALAADPRYDTVRKRAARADELVPVLRNALATRTALEWEALFGERVPCAAVRTVEDMFGHPQPLAEGMFADYAHPLAGRYRGFAGAFRHDPAGGEPPAAPRAAPTFGEHADEVLGEHGFSAAEIARLRGDGVVA
jgi:crotonobetainyl-CoA:carnitine CoA-transferase CaiB-like acyl-CoA transferase